MAISGLIGAGASDALEEILRQRLLQQEAEARRVQEAFARQLQTRQMDSLDKDRQERAQDREDLRSIQREALTQKGEAARQAQLQADQQAGRNTNASLALQMPGLSDEQRFNEVAGAAIRGADVPAAVITGLKAKPAEPKLYPVKTVDPKTGRPIAALKTQEEMLAGVPEYVAPEKPDKPPRTELTPGEKVTQTRQLKNEFNRDIGTYRELQRQAQQMEGGLAAARAGDLAAGSQAVLVTFQKILDPTSVVRESEYARSAAGQSLLNQIEGAFTRVAKGGAGVPVHELERFADLARTFTKNAAAGEAQVRQQYSDIATEFGLNPQHIVGGSPAMRQQPIQDGPAAPEARTSAERIAPPTTGKKFTILKVQ